IVGGQRIAQHTHNSIVQWRAAGIGDAEFEKGGRNSGVFVVSGNKRVEGAQVYLAWKCIVVKGQISKRVLATEINYREVGKAGQKFAPRSPSESIEVPAGELALMWWLQVSMQNACSNNLIILTGRFGANGKM